MKRVVDVRVDWKDIETITTDAIIKRIRSNGVEPLGVEGISRDDDGLLLSLHVPADADIHLTQSDADIDKWSQHHDDNDNSYYEMLSPYSSDGESADIHWRLRQKISDDKLIWYADHDAEVLDSNQDTEWTSLAAAMKSVEIEHQDIVESMCSEVALADCES